MQSIRGALAQRQIPPKRAARFLPHVNAVKGNPADFVLVSQIRGADNHAERAGMVLRLTDDLVSSRGTALKAVCNEVGFAAGAEYIDLRICATLAIRDREGNIPERILRPLEIWRLGLIAIAGGMTL